MKAGGASHASGVGVTRRAIDASAFDAETFNSLTELVPRVELTAV